MELLQQLHDSGIRAFALSRPEISATCRSHDRGRRVSVDLLIHALSRVSGDHSAKHVVHAGSATARHEGAAHGHVRIQNLKAEAKLLEELGGKLP
jgi:hypothetical protein